MSRVSHTGLLLLPTQSVTGKLTGKDKRGKSKPSPASKAFGTHKCLILRTGRLAPLRWLFKAHIAGPGSRQPYCQRWFVPGRELALVGRMVKAGQRNLKTRLLHHGPPSPPLLCTSSASPLPFPRNHSM